MSSSSLRAAKKLLGRAAETAWAVALAGGGLARGRRVARWSAAGGRVLAIAPHPDDEAIGCAGTLLRHACAGDQIGLLYVTDGGQSRALGLKPAAMVRRLARWVRLGPTRLPAGVPPMA